MWQRLVLGQPGWIWGILAVGLFLLLLLLFGYRREQLPWRLKIPAILLKSMAIGLTLLCLLEPLIARQRPKPQANWIAIVADDSQSMQPIIGVDSSVKDAEKKIDNETLVQWQKTMSSDADWQLRLAEDFRLRRYRFGNRLEAVDDLGSIQANETQSSLGRSLELLSDRFRDRPLAGVVLFSDGQATDLGSDPPAWEKLGFPVYPVRLPIPQGTKDLRVSSLTMRQSDFEAAPVTIVATLQNRGLRGRSVNVELIDEDSQVVQSQALKLEGNDSSQLVEFRFRPEEPGIHGYRVRTALSNSSPRINESDLRNSIELTSLNNHRSVVVDRGRGPYKILYVAGRPNWEHKFLRRALDEDDEIQLVSLVRIAKKEPKFSFRDSKIESANPLFAGFEDVAADEKEQYNEPVFVRLGVEDSTQLKSGFPKTSEELFEYQAVLLDDLESDFLSPDQQSLLRQFVSFRGGGLLYLGGQESMRGKNFRETVIAQLLPIYGEVRLTPTDGRLNDSGSPMFRFDLTREGWLQPFLRTADTEPAQKKSLSEMPHLQVLNESGGVKPGAVVLANAAIDASTQQPALVTQRFGKGRTAVLLIGDMWRWGLHNEKTSQSPLFQAWRQMIRWLIADVPRSISMRVEPAMESMSGQTARIFIEVLSTEFQTMDNVDIEINVTKPDGSGMTGKAEPSTTQLGLYELPLMTIEEGVYKASASVRDPDGSVRGTSQIGWVHEPSATELQSLGLNPSLLEEIAHRSGGQVLDLEDLNQLSVQMSERPVPITETKIEPLWHHSWVLATILACLGGEWWIRRKNGLR